MEFIQNIKNSFDFFLRQHLAFSRTNYYEKNESKDGLLESEDVILREQSLFEKFGLDVLKSNTTRENYLENLDTIDLLESYLEVDFVDNLKVLDLGCKNWFYAKSEWFFFKKYCQNLRLDGIELDANRLNVEFYSRTEIAKFHIKDLKGAKYIAGDFLNRDEKYDYIVWILPFVIEYPLMMWGLPQKFFQPEKMLLHAFNSLNKKGKIFIINQGEAEYNAQHELCKKLNIPCNSIGVVKDYFVNYTIPRYLTLIEN